MNKTFVIGNLGAKPETKHLEGGNVVSKFSVASTRKYTNKRGDQVSETEWFRFEAWGKLAEVIEKYLDKGSLVYVEGRQRTEKYTDKDGTEKTFIKLIVENLKMLGGKSENSSQPSKTQSTGATKNHEPAPATFDDIAFTGEDDLPF